MRRRFGIPVLAFILAAAPSTGMAREAGPSFDAGSLSGAFLAARSAEVDNDLRAAIGYYRDALSYDADNIGMMQSLMLALISQGQFDQSLPHAQKLKDVPDAERLSRLALAVDAFREKDYSQAVELLRMPDGSDLDELVTGIMSAWAMAGDDDVDGAMDYLDNLTGPDWFKLFTSYHKALILAQTDRDQETKQTFADLVSDMAAAGAAPDTYMRGVEAYARYLARLGQKDEALAVLEKSSEFVTGIVTVTALEEDIRTDARIAPMIATKAEGAAEILYNIGTALNRSGSEAFVKLYFQFALAMRPDDAAILLHLGGIAEKQDDAEQAISYFERVPDTSPLYRIAELQMGLNLADLKRHDEAVEHLENVLGEDPDDMRAYLALGGVYASDKNFADAAKVYERAVERIGEPEKADWNIFYQRGIAYERLKEWDKAEPNFRKALELFPDQPQVLNYLGYSWVDMGRNLDEGLEMIAKAVEQRPSDGYIVDSLGWAYYRLGRYDDAVRELERAVSLMPNDPVLNDHLGDAYWRVGRRLEATFQWNHARDLDPEPELKEQVLTKLEEGLAPVENPAAVEKAPEPVSPKTELAPADSDKRG